jgi:outer membrane protein assembly factor BamB
MLRVMFVVCIASISAPPPSAAQNTWPQLRGERASGMAAGQNLPEAWNRSENILWVVAVPGRGWSSPIVWGSRVYLTTVVNQSATKEPEQGFYRPMDVSTPEGEHEWTVLCLDTDSGRTLWQRVVHRGRPGHTIHVKNNYAPETPATDGERVVVYFGNVGLFCFNFNGEPLWSQKWAAKPMRLGWGTGSSPIIHRERVYVQNDNEEASVLVALDKRTGAELWRTQRDEKSSWATPFVWEHDLRTEIVTSATARVRSYDLNGKLLWELSGMSSICVPMPIAAHDLLIVSSGYEFARPRPMYAIRPGADGDISLGQGQTENKFIAWYREPAGAYHPTPLFDGQRLYVLYSRGTLACFDPRTGQDVYGQQRLGGSFTASPVACDGKIYCCDENGLTYVIQAGPEFKVLAQNNLNEMSLATPAIAGSRLYVRTLSHLYCIQNAALRP